MALALLAMATPVEGADAHARAIAAARAESGTMVRTAGDLDQRPGGKVPARLKPIVPPMPLDDEVLNGCLQNVLADPFHPRVSSTGTDLIRRLRRTVLASRRPA